MTEPLPALAHAGEPHLGLSTVLRWWTFAPVVSTLLLASGAAYLRGLRRLRRVARGRGVRGWEVACVVAGWLTIWVALVSPVDRLSEILFSAHMVQHELLMVLAAPLLVLGRPWIAVLWGLPARVRRGVAEVAARPRLHRAWRGLTLPLAVLLLHGAAVWVWHLPFLYQAALRHEGVHALQHAAFFWTAALLWFALVHGAYGRMGYGVAVVMVFVTAVHTSVLGALMTFASSLWYPLYADRGRPWGVSPLADQQLAGVYMWIPSGVTFVVLGLGLVAAWIGEAERRIAYVEGPGHGDA